MLGPAVSVVGLFYSFRVLFCNISRALKGVIWISHSWPSTQRLLILNTVASFESLQELHHPLQQEGPLTKADSPMDL